MSEENRLSRIIHTDYIINNPYNLDMVEQLGSGVPRILKVYSKECFVFGDSFTRMVFPLKSSVKILELIKNNKNITIPEIAKEIELSTRAVEKQIAKLKEEKSQNEKTKGSNINNSDK